MAYHSGRTRRTAGFWLLIASLVFLAGAAVAPLAHLRIQQQELAQQTDADGRLPVHHAQHCAVCHAAADVPLPSAAVAALPAVLRIAPPALAAQRARPADPARSRLRARAPPLARSRAARQA